MSDDLVLVRNKTNELINLRHCQLKGKGATGMATFAEFTTHYQTIERVEEPKVETVQVDETVTSSDSSDLYNDLERVEKVLKGGK